MNSSTGQSQEAQGSLTFLMLPAQLFQHIIYRTEKSKLL